jgi:hypothetical protein
MRRILTFFGLIMLVLGGFSVGAPTAHAAPPYGTDKWALLVGVDHFSGKTRSNVGGVGDVQDINQLLINSGWPQDHIRTLTDGAATQQAIREGLRWLVDNSGPNSFSVFHYSGHTKQVSRDPDGDGEAVDEFLWPTDNRFISDFELAQSMNALRGWAWIDLSGCEGAGLADNIATDRHLVTASSQETEKSYENADWHNSVWTFFMVDQGMLQGGADSNRDGRVTLTEAWGWAAHQAAQYTNGQKNGPQHAFMAGGDGTEWLLNPPPPPPPPKPAAPPKKHCMVNLPGVPCI